MTFSILFNFGCGGGGGGGGSSRSYTSFDDAVERQNFPWDKHYNLLLRRDGGFVEESAQWFRDPTNVSLRDLVAYYDVPADSTLLSATLSISEDDGSSASFEMLYDNDTYCEDISTSNAYWDDVCVTQEWWDWGEELGGLNPYDDTFSVRGNVINIDMSNQLGITEYVVPSIFLNDYFGTRVFAIEAGSYDFIPLVFGDATAVTDVPSSGVITYNLVSLAVCACEPSAIFDRDFELLVGQMSGQLVADFNQKTIEGSVTLSYAMPYSPGTVRTYNLGYGQRDYVYRISGDISGNGFNASFASEDGFTFHEFKGGFYGPRALELGLTGYAFEAKSGFQSTTVFTVIGSG